MAGSEVVAVWAFLALLCFRNLCLNFQLADLANRIKQLEERVTWQEAK